MLLLQQEHVQHYTIKEMARSSKIKINPAMLQWARQRLGITIEELAIGLKKKPEQIESWEQGKEYPTYRQAQKLAKKLVIPLGFLFLSEPPVIKLPIPDFRISPQAREGKFSPELLDVIYDALRKRDWYRELKVERGEKPLEFVGRFSLDDAPEPEIVAEDMRATLGVDPGFRRQVQSWGDHMNKLVNLAEDQGILVLRNSCVGVNTHRRLSPEEFKGFAIVDEYAPVIFINTADYKVSQIFTLAHEMAHLWINQGGISDPIETYRHKNTPKVERFCNRVAAEFLVPQSIFRSKWQRDKDMETNLEELARFFRVSKIVVLIRAVESRLCSREDFLKALRGITRSEKPEKKGGGADFYKLLPIRNSPLFTREITHELLSGRVLYTEAAELLGLKFSALDKWIRSAVH